MLFKVKKCLLLKTLFNIIKNVVTLHNQRGIEMIMWSAYKN